MSEAGQGFPAPGWFGKLPGSGDFAHRRLDAAFIVRWDAWLQHEMLAMRQRHPDWVQAYLTAPLWCFLLAPGLLEVRGAQGVLMPSVDRVGRYFPLTLIRWLGDEARAAGLAEMARWWALACRAALAGLQADLDANAFDELLQRSVVDGCGPSCDAAGPALEWPGVGQSVWCILDQGGQAARTLWSPGLPAGSDFDLLFDLSPWPQVVAGVS